MQIFFSALQGNNLRHDGMLQHIKYCKLKDVVSEVMNMY